MDGNAFLFKVPCPQARRRILSQSLWQVDGQTMFVTKWSPGPLQEKPELSMVPVWLEFIGVPFQFFNRDGLQEFAGMVGHPVGHIISRCKAAPPTCNVCKSVKHNTENCPRSGVGKNKGKAPIKSLLPIVPLTGVPHQAEPKIDVGLGAVITDLPLATHQNSHQNLLKADSIDLSKGDLCVDLSSHKAAPSGVSDVDPGLDERNTSDDEDNPYSGHDKFIEVVSKRTQKKAKMKSQNRAGGPPNL